MDEGEFGLGVYSAENTQSSFSTAWRMLCYTQLSTPQDALRAILGRMTY